MIPEERHQLAQRVAQLTHPREFYQQIKPLVSELSQLADDDAAALRDKTAQILNMTSIGLTAEDLRNQRTLAEWAAIAAEVKPEPRRGLFDRWLKR